MQSGVMIVSFNGFDVSFDVPIIENKYIIGEVLDNFINTVVLSSRRQRVTELSTVTNAAEVVDLIRNTILPKTPDQIKETSLLNLKSITVYMMDLKAKEFGFDSLLQAISFSVDSTSPFYLRAKSLLKWQSEVWTYYLSNREEIVNGTKEYNHDTYRNDFPVFEQLSE